MKIVIIGGGSFSTPNLLNFLATRKDQPQFEVVLAGRSRERLDAVCRAALLLIDSEFQVRTELTEGNNWRPILEDAEAVVIQIRVGGMKGRLFDETFPHKYGLCGDEGLGVGGVSAGWRTWPILAPILERIKKLCPHAFVILLTSPLDLLVRASLSHVDLNLVGICELPWTTLQAISGSLGLPPNQVESDYIGVNHFGWFFNIRSDNQELIKEVTEKEGSFPAGEFLKIHGCFPTRYLRMHYEAEAALSEQKRQKMPRAVLLANVQKQCYAAYARGPAADVRSALAKRDTPWYKEAVGPLLLAFGGRETEVPFFLSVRNGGYAPFLEPEDIIECRHQWLDRRLQRQPLRSAPPQHIVENLAPMVEFARLVSDAVMARSTRLLEQALAMHPWTRNHSQAAAIVDEIVTGNTAIAKDGD